MGGRGRQNGSGANAIKQTKKGRKATEQNPHMQKELMRAKNINATIMILRNFLSLQDICSLQHLGPLGKWQNHDRSEELDFEHIVYRFETPLKDNDKQLYDRLLNAMFMADQELWRGIPTGGPARNKLHPEIEFISYDADACAMRGGRHPYIGPHVDNASAVTLIGMLSQFYDDAVADHLEKMETKCSSPSVNWLYQGMKGGKKAGQNNHNNSDRGYAGGYNRFEIGGAEFSKDAEDGGIAKGMYRETRLNKGDILMFRGEMVEHSLTSVTAGLRQIVQIELCREKEGRH